jgi:hypothetical protein
VGTVDRRGPQGTVGARSLTINLRTAHAAYNAHLARYNPQARPWTTCRHLLSPIYHEITFFVSDDTHVRTASCFDRLALLFTMAQLLLPHLPAVLNPLNSSRSPSPSPSPSPRPSTPVRSSPAPLHIIAAPIPIHSATSIWT